MSKRTLDITYRPLQKAPDTPEQQTAVTNQGRQLATRPISKRRRGAAVRRSTTKVRSGCITCKNRKVKCDETKPACLNCQRLKDTICEGYDPPKPWVFDPCTNPDEISTSEAGSQSELAAVLHELSKVIVKSPNPAYGSAVETRSFHYWNDVTAITMSRRSDPYFWSILLPQRSWVCPSIKYALIASALQDESRFFTGKSKVNLHQQALRTYNQAIKIIMDAKDVSVEDILLTCLAFYCFEGWCANYQNAAKHIYGAATIVETWKAKGHANRTTAETENNMHRIIIPMVEVGLRYHQAALEAGGSTPKGTFKPATPPQPQTMLSNSGVSEILDEHRSGDI